MLSHLDKMSVKTGQRVAAGQGVGRVGLTGSAGDAHLHLQLVRLTKRPDPANEEHHSEFNNHSPNIPALPFDITVPFDVPVMDVTAGMARAPRKIKSTEFRGGEAGALPEHAGTYQVPAKTDG
jgi:murein DD-endopeptidase MepM/ murein hydrolase activator NlpD